jgi:hypothetical protein
MTRLQDLHRRLARLKHRRQRFRWETGYSAVVIALLWALAAAFAVDWLFEQSMNVWWRAGLLALVAGAVSCAFFAYTLPWLGQRETELDMALLVEHHEHIDSDLVAALQFESPDAPQWGSVQLEEAVIEQVATTGRHLNVMKSLPRDQLAYRLKLLVVTVAVWALVALAFPQHVVTFLNRMALGSQHYPTRTHIVALTINGRDTSQGTVKLLYGQSAKFRVECVDEKNEFPESGKVVIQSVNSGLSVPVTLERVKPEEYAKTPGDKPAEQTPAEQKTAEQKTEEQKAADQTSAEPKTAATKPEGEKSEAAKEGREVAVYEGVLPRLVEDAQYQVYVGDAWTDPASLGTTELPVVKLDIVVVPPAYAAGKTPDGKEGGPIAIPDGMRQFSVVEGSQVRMTIRCENKRLMAAALTLDDTSYNMTQNQRRTEEGAPDLWTLPPEQTALEAVVQPLRYSVQVKDEDGQELEQPIRGTIRITVDTPPRIAAHTVTPYVLPEKGKPRIYFGVRDDHAVGRVWLTYEVVHGDSKSSENVTGQGECPIYKLAEGAKPQAELQDSYGFVIAPLKVSKGDTIRVTLHAQDYRGRREGKTASAEPLAFQVTDLLGFQASMLEVDKQSARELKIMIQRELGIGETQ